MSLDDARQSWRDEVDRPPSPEELGEGLAAVQRRFDRLERVIHWRDIREILAAVLVVAIFAAMWPLYRSSRVATLGAAVIVLGGGLSTFMLLSARKPAPLPFDASVQDFSRHRLAWLDAQIRLLGGVAWWYVGPAFVGSLLWAWSLTGGMRLAFGLFVLADVAFAAWVIALNRRAVRDELLPVREEVARMVKALGPDDLD